MTTRESVLSAYKSSLPHRIMGFFGEHRALSNFHIESFEWSNHLWTSSEAAYQASKGGKDQYTRFAAMDAAKAKKEGGLVKLIHKDWDTVKLEFMMDILRHKFKQCDIARKVLMSTGDAHLEECNWWKDKIWGTYNGVGENYLGKMLMTIRKSFHNGNNHAEGH
jgi:ribA/ribD-fused uncharacterized protein